MGVVVDRFGVSGRMREFLILPENLPFVVSLGFTLGLLVIELVSMIFGFGLSNVMDSVMPDFDADIDVDLDVDADTDVDIDAPQAGGSPGFLSWLGLGKVPLAVLMVLALTFFGLFGITLQSIFSNASGSMVNTWLASAIALAATLPCLSWTAKMGGKYVFNDETDALSESTFIGHVAVITLGETAKGKPSQAKFRDKNGQTHYVIVEPHQDDAHFSKGDEVVIVHQVGSKFEVVENNVDALGKLKVGASK